MTNLIDKYLAQASVKQCEEFVCLIPKLNAFEFMGLAKILSIPIVDSEQEITADTNPKDIKSREFEDILSDMIDMFCGLRRARRREILAMLRRVKRETVNASNRTKEDK